jgi:hypothetical protein
LPVLPWLPRKKGKSQSATLYSSKNGSENGNEC